MKTKLILTTIIASTVVLLFAQNPAKANDNSTPNGLSKADIESIQYMREEEKLAHDVYTFYAEQYDIPIFRNISRSETVHQKAIIWLMNEYGLEDLSKEKAGEFNNRELQKMYNDLTKDATLIDALEAGALVEEHDIQDLEMYLQKTNNADIQRIYTNLLRGSENHLRAFVRNLSFRGIDYVPTILSADEFDSILQK